ncbi:hypothetical protein GCM10023171_30190 [Microbacterium panaciterrae]|uniref:Plasmid pRiA4b Orf3-like domain-containing protein n=1 Tax=Microbacterium panaciterrae TaxID=985759 RepID=A0ABP8PPQ3_9MICO
MSAQVVRLTDVSRYRLRVTLEEADPAIWRAFEIDGRLPLRMLHVALQTIMGWRELHLHAFVDADPQSRSGVMPLRWAPQDFENPVGTRAEEDYAIDDVLRDRSTLWYEYDFGDGWVHRIDVTDVLEDDSLRAPVVLLDGGGRGPFEDAGGVHGYAEKVEALADPQHPEYRELSNWARATVGPWVPLASDFLDPIGVQSELNLLFNPQGSGMSPYDMSGLVKDDALRRPSDLDVDSPLVALASTLPPPIRSELRQHLGRTGVLDAVDVDDATALRLIRPFAWLMDAVGPEGIALTSAGWLPPDTVLDGMTTLGWIDDWIGKGNREDLTPPIANLREGAQRMGLVRAQKGRLLLGAAAKKALGDPQAQLRLVAGATYRKLSDAETDAAVLLLLSIADGTPAGERWKAVAFGLEMCGWQSASGRAFTPTDIDHVTHHVQRVLDAIGESGRRERRTLALADQRLFARVALR